MKTQNVRMNAKRRLFLAAFLIASILLPGSLASCTTNSASNNVLTHTLSEPLGDVTMAKFDINTGTGNLTVDRIAGGEPALASGALQYLEDQGLPYRSLSTINGQATLAWAASGVQQPGSHFPWEACNGETEWQVYLNSNVSYDLTAHSDGGNVKLNLAGMKITGFMADTGGGNMEVILPDSAASLNVTAKTGAGNVTVRLPGGTAARIHATSGMGKIIVDSRFRRIDDRTYQSVDYDNVANKVEITLSSGAGNVSVETME